MSERRTLAAVLTRNGDELMKLGRTGGAVILRFLPGANVRGEARVKTRSIPTVGALAHRLARAWSATFKRASARWRDASALAISKAADFCCNRCSARSLARRGRFPSLFLGRPRLR